MIRIRQVKVPIMEDNEKTIINKISKKLHIKTTSIKDYQVIKKSIDARHKDSMFYVYEFDADIEEEASILKKYHSNDVFLSPTEEYLFPKKGTNKLEDKIIIVGSGPSGLFCAYLLAQEGYKPLVIERGEKIEDRIKSVENFFETNNLNPDSNIQFGEGGAGTFSDGKLNTLTKDKFNRCKKVFEIFIENGAPKEIMYIKNPHIGTDILRQVIANIRNKIIAMGGSFMYNSKLTDINIENDRIKSIVINKEKIYSCSILVLAIGHSARETFYLLHDKGLNMKAKNFAVGVRVEHKQEMINQNQYGKYSKYLEPASYKLTYQASTNRGVYSFCMCPGGFVVNASSEKNHLVINGMSNYKRDEENANSAIVVTVSKNDFASSPLAGIEFQRALEEKAYTLGKGYIPVQLLGDYLNNKETTALGSITPNTKGKYTYANLNELFPGYINNSLKEAFIDFDQKIKGFANPDSILLGVETRTSSPVVIERNELGVSNIKGIYPCGEGAGYAGGITTSAIDGIKVAENIARVYYE